MTRATILDSRPLGVLAALASALFFGLNAIAAKILYGPTALPRFDAVGLFVARGLWTLPLFIALAVIARPKRLPRLTRESATLFILCGLAYGPGTNALSALGVSATSASHAVLLLSLFPPLAAVLAAALLREQLALVRILAILVGVAGAAALTFSGSASGASITGDALIAGFVLTWALLTVGIRQLDRSYPPLFVAGVFGALGGLFLAAIGAALGRLSSGVLPLQHLDGHTFLWFDLELVLLLSLGGQLLQSVALRALKVGTVVALTAYGSIFAGIAASRLILGERLATGDIVAGVILLTALALSLVPEGCTGRGKGSGTTEALGGKPCPVQ